jgi:HSP20 family molecular chaperone IbpA
MQSFSRSFSLDDTVDAEKATAKYEDGMLKLTAGRPVQLMTY